ncbi:hypothetical protein [Idiomarina xiamenensis]|uniref:Integral membrane protein n=1 Tax=Idiomarina xiamenensis 10-D-4 TaxID=740709 RepID=K2KG51_9GAMM|nr:hypothetical protein [Idiomarina xiamenensis]EKE86988.1 hypothetical protein A10D4_02062 [Idiomarina xiamenensis 10-D-4]
MDTDKRMIIGGDLSRALRGDYHLGFAATLKNAWQLSLQYMPQLLLGGIVLILMSSIVISLILGDQLRAFLSIVEAVQNGAELTADKQQQASMTLMQMQLVYQIVSAPLWGGIFLMGIHQSIGLKTRVRDIFAGFSRLLPLITVAVVGFLISQLGQYVLALVSPVLSILFQSYCTLIFILAMPLCMERQLSPLRSLYASTLIVNKKITVFAALYALIGILLVLTPITYGLVGIIAFPLLVTTTGVIYREAVGVEVRLRGDDNDRGNGNTNVTDNNDSWSA